MATPRPPKVPKSDQQYKDIIYKRANRYTFGHHFKCLTKDKNDSDNLYQAYDKWKAKQSVRNKFLIAITHNNMIVNV